MEWQTTTVTAEVEVGMMTGTGTSDPLDVSLFTLRLQSVCVYAGEAYCLPTSLLPDDDRREPRYDDRRGGGYERGYDRGGHDYRSGGGDYRGGAGDYRGGGGSGGGYRDERSYDPRSRY